MLILLSLLATDLPVDIGALKRIDQHVTAEEPAAPRRSPYRLDLTVTDATDGKADALAITGADCDRIGTAFCTSTPRKIYATSY